MYDTAVAPDALLYKKSIAAGIERRDKPTQEYDWRKQQQPSKRRNDIKCSFK